MPSKSRHVTHLLLAQPTQGQLTGSSKPRTSAPSVSMKKKEIGHPGGGGVRPAKCNLVHDVSPYDHDHTDFIKFNIIMF